MHTWVSSCFSSLRMLLFLSLCSYVTNSIVVNAPNLFTFWPVREFLVEMHTAKMVLWGVVFTSWESKRANFTQAAILQPRVQVLLVLAVFPAFAASTWQEGRPFDRLDGCKKDTDLVTILNNWRRWCHSWRVNARVALRRFDPFYPFLPSFVGFRILMDPLKTQYRIWKDVDLRALKVDDSFIRQVFPWMVFPTNCFQSRDLILLTYDCSDTNFARSEQTTGLTVLLYFSACGLRRLWLSCLVFTRLSDAVEDSADGAVSLLRAIKFIIGLDFAVTLSSPDSFCVLFDITSEHTVELKWLMFNNTKDDSIRHVWNFPWLACLRVGFWCQYSWFGSWGPNWFDRTTNQEQFCGFWKHVSLLDFFPLWSSWSLLRCLQRCTTKLLDANIERLRGTRSTLSKSLITLPDCWRPWFVWGQTTGLTVLSWFWVVFPRTKTIRSHKSGAGEGTV